MLGAHLLFFGYTLKKYKIHSYLEGHTERGCRLDLIKGHSVYDMEKQKSEVSLHDAQKGNDNHFMFWKDQSGSVGSILEFDGSGGCCGDPDRK